MYLSMMAADDVWQVLEALKEQAVSVWVDGGWGVDALLGRQTRPHDDLDVVIALDRAVMVIDVLARNGYRLSEDERPTRFVMCDGRDRRIDFHTVTFDAEGGGIQRLQSGRSYRYPPNGFRGRGIIAGRAISCLTPEVQIECHLGYEPDETDIRDVRLLCETFGIRLPPPYQRTLLDD